MSDKQSFFDKSTAAVIAQGRKSYGESVVNMRTTCLYRGSDGAKCVVGHMISDEQIEKYHVGNTYSVWSIDGKLIAELLPESAAFDSHQTQQFLADLQEAHDLADEHNFVNDFTARANKVALGWNLSPIGAKA